MPRWKEPQPGTCRVCGCTDDRACHPACSWVDAKHTLCSACTGTVADAFHAMRWARFELGKGRRFAATMVLAKAMTRIAERALMPPPLSRGDLISLVLEMGAVIRKLDETGEHSEFWTQDGGYVIDSRFPK